MKAKHSISLIGALILLFCTGFALGQEAAKKQLFVIHEDIVKPSKVAQYEKAAKKLVSKLNEFGISGVNYAAAATNDFHYLYVTPVENMAELDKNTFAELESKVGKEGMKEIWKGFDGCYDVHKNYMITLSHELSYNPENNQMTDEDQPYRRWQYFHIKPEKEEAAMEIAKKWKALYEKKNIQVGYRVYIGGLGAEMPLLGTVQWAKDAADFNAKNAEAIEILGEEGTQLWEKTLAITRKYETKEGKMRYDLAYTPKQPLAEK